MVKKGRKSRRQYQVFLSHSHQDRWICSVLKEKIEAHGIAVWLDAADVPGGANVKDRIKQGVRECDECLVLLSPASRRSDWVLVEIGMAEVLDKWLTPLLLHVAAKALPGPIRERNPISINDCEAYLKELVNRKSERG